ncbi:MAG: asparagine synthase (glutamine-hydrolyzing) [Planctomycetota bacterium]
MCGFAGVLDPRWRGSAEDLAGLARALAAPLRARGPDDEGAWTDPARGLGLAHRRLAVLDLSPTGHQPMPGARCVLAYNGEVYDHEALRAELAAGGHAFRGSSDTEVLLALCERALDAPAHDAPQGLARALARVNGMFALALWDRERGALALARDRLGIKPLYWAKQGERVLFGSELRALRAAPGFSAELDPDALAAYLRRQYVPSPRTIYRDARAVAPGTILWLEPGQPPREERYWELPAPDHDALGRDAPGSQGDGRQGGAAELAPLLRAAVRRRLRADVPLGAWLSGGVDSSLVAALAQEARREAGAAPLMTFSVGFDQADLDEAPWARAVAAHLGTEHHELRVTGAEALAAVERLPELCDQPFADSSLLPTALLSVATRRHATVALSGDGGDELFLGYPRYADALRLAERARDLPAPLRAAARALRRLPSSARGPLVGRLPGGLARRARRAALGDLGEVYRHLVSLWERPDELVLEGQEPREGPLFEPLQTAEDLARADLLTYLPDDLLTKVDRASMAASLEVRVPLLDHTLVERALRLPPEQRQGKAPLRRLLAELVPRALWERPKGGFAVPLGPWLRGPLRPWAEALLAPERLAREEVLRPGPVRAAWTRLLAGRDEEAQRVWAVLAFQAWWERQGA